MMATVFITQNIAFFPEILVHLQLFLSEKQYFAALNVSYWKLQLWM